MNKQKYVFVGNRPFVLKEMVRMGLEISGVWVMKDSPLHNQLKGNPFITYSTIANKQQLIKEIEETEFDVLVSNGCKYILPISELKSAKYINIHPSYLPDLKGKNPINGAFLFDRRGGATCHVMDDGIDTGKIIARVEIPMTKDLDSGLLYQLCFKAEEMVFRKAYENKFVEMERQPYIENAIYYSAKPEDMNVNFEAGVDYVLRQVKAFGHKAKGLYFGCNNKKYHFYNASEITNTFVLEYCKTLENLRVAFVFDDSVVFKFDDKVVRFDAIDESCKEIKEGDYLFTISADMLRNE